MFYIYLKLLSIDSQHFINVTVLTSIKLKKKKIESRFQYFWTRLLPFHVCFFSLELLQEANSEPSQLNFEVIDEIS